MPYFRPHRAHAISITVDYGYDVHSVSVSFAEWARIASGKPAVISGHGFPVEGKRLPDRWRFNTESTGSLIVFTNDGFDIYSGLVSDAEVFVRDAEGNRVPSHAS